MPRVTILLKPREMAALRDLAEHECRDLRSQATLIVRSELQRAGVLPVSEHAPVEPDHQLSTSQFQDNS